MKMDFWTLQAATVFAAWAMALGFLALLFVLIQKIMTDKIDLGTLLEEKDGTNKTSIGRFQLLMFTLAIVGLFVILSIEAGTFVDVPNGVLGLLGISGGSFLVSKGIGTPAGKALQDANARTSQVTARETTIVDVAPATGAAPRTGDQR